MKMEGACMVCGSNLAKHACKHCGSIVCDDHFNKTMNTCLDCQNKDLEGL